MFIPLELKLFGTLWSVDLVRGVGVGVLVFWGRGPLIALVLRHTCPRKEAPAELSEVGFGISSSGLYCE